MISDADHTNGQISSVPSETKCDEIFKLFTDANFANNSFFVLPVLNNSIDVTSSGLVRNWNYDYSCYPYACSLPVPLDVTGVLKGKKFKGIDYVSKLVKDKSMWEARKFELIDRNLKLKNCVRDTEVKRMKMMPRDTVSLAQHLVNNPDPSFSGFYNWYYTGGCLDYLFLNNMYSLLYVNDNLPGTCVLTPVSSESSGCVLSKDSSVFLKTDNKEHIHQITTKNNFIAIRQNKFSSLFAVTNERKLKIKEIHKHSEKKKNIVSISISDNLDGQYCTLTTSHKLKLWSPEVTDNCVNCVNVYCNKTSKCRNCGTDNWGSVLYTSINNILVSSRSCVYLKDTRMELEKNAQEWEVDVNKLPCDFISMMMKSNSRDYSTYIGTARSLYELDSRKGLSKQWFHMMELPPMYSAISPVLDDTEMLYIGSQNISEVCAIDSNLHVMPYMLPSLYDAKSKINDRGLCLDPSVASRFYVSMVGMTVIPDNRSDSAFVFRSNSVGDVFYQNVSKNKQDGFCNNDFDLYSNWEKDCRNLMNSVKSKPFKVTSIKDFSDELDYMNRTFNNVTKDSGEKLYLETKFPWAIPNSRLVEATDVLSQKLTEAWEIEIIGEDEVPIKKEDEVCSNFRIDVDEHPTIKSEVFDNSYCEGHPGNSVNETITRRPLSLNTIPTIKSEVFDNSYCEGHPGNSVNETITRRPLSSTLEDLKILFPNKIPTIKSEVFDNSYCEGLALPTGPLQKTRKLKTKNKSLFSSGF